MPTKSFDPRSTTVVPVEYAGKWVAWSADHSQIVAHSDNLRSLWQLVRDQKIENPIFEKVPRADVRFVGVR
jgi:hypothetical protein